MRKVLGLLALVLVIGIGSAFVYADSPIRLGAKDKDIDNRYERMEDFHRERLEEEVKRGNITEEEAKDLEDHYEYMDEFHSKYGHGGCHGRRGMMGRGHHGRMRGRHHRGWNW